MAGRIAAGRPLEAVEERETFSLANSRAATTVLCCR